MKCTFIYDLEENEEVKEKKGIFGEGIFYGVRYYKTENGIMVHIGDVYRHEIILESKYWNRILRIIRDKEIDENGVNAIVLGLFRPGLYPEYASNFITAIREEKIKEIKE